MYLVVCCVVADSEFARSFTWMTWSCVHMSCVAGLEIGSFCEYMAHGRGFSRGTRLGAGLEADRGRVRTPVPHKI